MFAGSGRSEAPLWATSTMWESSLAQPGPTYYTRAVDLFAGTSGYSYKEWKGAFYPEDLPAKEFLRFYATHFESVEINNTFYRMPQKNVVAQWASEVPDNFTFVLKASQRITHQKRLKDAASEVDYFFEVAKELGPKQ